MPPAVRGLIQRALREGTLGAASPLTATHGIGLYIERRLRRALKATGSTQPLTLGEFWAATQTRTTAQVERILQRALQNRRANQCVPTSPGQHAVYHTGDINQVGYEATVTLLDYARTRMPAPVRYGILPRRLAERSASAKRCGCRAICDGPCVSISGVCVPRSARRGFTGSPPHPNQAVTIRTAADRARVRRQARRSGGTAWALYNDPDSAIDLAAGHPNRVRYVQRGNQMWRSPGRKVRAPVVRR